MKKFSSALFLLALSTSAFAQEAHAATSGMTEKTWLYICGLFAVAIAAIGGTNAQSRAAAVALEGVGRNPASAGKMLVPMVLSLALIESLVILTFASIFVVK